MPDRAFLIFGSVLILVGLFFAFEGRIFVAYGVETQAVVESYEEKRRYSDDSHNRYNYYPIVRYQVGTESYTYRSGYGERVPPSIGSTRILYYRPSKPTTARLEGELTGLGSRGAGAFVILAIGIAMGLKGLPGLMASIDLSGAKEEEETAPRGDSEEQRLV
ncbi:MAG: DUF3592 domain-containing protein [Myxococcota bacterium]